MRTSCLFLKKQNSLLLGEVDKQFFVKAQRQFDLFMKANKLRHRRHSKPFIPIPMSGNFPAANACDATDDRSYFFSSEIPVAMKDTINQMITLLTYPRQCVSLLKELDKDIANHQFFLKRNFSARKPGVGLFLSYSLQVPALSSRLPSDLKSDITDDLLLYLIRKKLQPHGIETQDAIHTFVGFVDEDKANNIVRKGALFKEHFLTSNFLVHGVYSHYFQWYLFAAAVDEGIIVLPKGVTLKNVLTGIIDNGLLWSFSGTISLWQQMIDFFHLTPGFNAHHLNFYLGQPHRLNSLLLFSRNIPHLRGYLLELWHKNVIEFQAHYKEVYSIEIPYNCLVAAQTAAGPYTNQFDAGEDFNNSIEDYYQKKGIEHSYDKDAGIIKQSAKVRFADIPILDKQNNSRRALKKPGLFSVSKVEANLERKALSFVPR